MMGPFLTAHHPHPQPERKTLRLAKREGRRQSGHLHAALFLKL